MNKYELKKLKNKLTDGETERLKEIELNPLSQYSTTQLKRELRRRKRW